MLERDTLGDVTELADVARSSPCSQPCPRPTQSETRADELRVIWTRSCIAGSGFESQCPPPFVGATRSLLVAGRTHGLIAQVPTAHRLEVPTLEDVAQR
jgi:hypothetical protein